MTDQAFERDDRDAAEEDPLESAEPLQEPQDDDEEQDRAPQPGLAPDVDDTE